MLTARHLPHVSSSYCAQQAFTVLRITLNTTLALRLNCAHCVFTAISWMALHTNDAFTMPKQRSPRVSYATYHVLIAPNKHSPCSVSRSTPRSHHAWTAPTASLSRYVQTTLLLRVSNAHPYVNYTPITLLVRLNEDLITRQLRWPRSYINTVQPSGQHHFVLELQVSELCHQKTREEAVQGGNAKQWLQRSPVARHLHQVLLWKQSLNNVKSHSLQPPRLKHPCLNPPRPWERRRHWRCQCHEQDQRCQHDEPHGQEDQAPQFPDRRRGAEHGGRSMTCSCVASSITHGVLW